MSRVLIVKLGAIGDVIMLLPAVHQLHLAGHQVDWLCGPAVLPILQLYPWLQPSNLIPVDDLTLFTGSRSVAPELASFQRARVWSSDLIFALQCRQQL